MIYKLQTQINIRHNSLDQILIVLDDGTPVGHVVSVRKIYYDIHEITVKILPLEGVRRALAAGPQRPIFHMYFPRNANGEKVTFGSPLG